MKKKLLSIALGSLLVMTVLSGCGDSTTTDENTTDVTVDETTAEDSVTTDDVASVEQTQVYVSPEWVNSVINGNQEESSDYVILECAWGDVSVDEAYQTAHITGALHMNTDNIESPEKWDVRPADEINQVMLDFGITKDTTVIIYAGTANNTAADRVAFTMLWAGVENVKELSGGLTAWTEAGLPTEEGINEATAVESFGATIPAHPEYILDTDQIIEKLATDDNFKLVSIRSWEEYIGNTSGYSYIDKAGEPEGAIWGHDTDDGSYTNEDGTVVDVTKLEEFMTEAGATLENELSFYCGTGWRASRPFLIGYQAGMKNISLYDDGWFVYQNDVNGDLSVQLGDPSSDDFSITTVDQLTTDKARK